MRSNAWSVPVRAGRSAAASTSSSPHAFLETSVNWLASVRGRLGFIVWNQMLFYATGGVALGRPGFSCAGGLLEAVAPSFAAVAHSESGPRLAIRVRAGWSVAGSSTNLEAIGPSALNICTIASTTPIRQTAAGSSHYRRARSVFRVQRALGRTALGSSFPILRSNPFASV